MHPDHRQPPQPPPAPQPNAAPAQPGDGADLLFAMDSGARLGVALDGSLYVDMSSGLRFGLPFWPVPAGQPDF